MKKNRKSVTGLRDLGFASKMNPFFVAIIVLAVSAFNFEDFTTTIENEPTTTEQSTTLESPESTPIPTTTTEQPIPTTTEQSSIPTATIFQAIGSVSTSVSSTATTDSTTQDLNPITIAKIRKIIEMLEMIDTLQPEATAKLQTSTETSKQTDGEKIVDRLW